MYFYLKKRGLLYHVRNRKKRVCIKKDSGRQMIADDNHHYHFVNINPHEYVLNGYEII